MYSSKTILFLSIAILLFLTSGCIDDTSLNSDQTPQTTEYTVNYNGNDNTGGYPPKPFNYRAGVTVTVAGNSGNLVKEGYHFSGWNTEPDGSGTNYTAGNGTFVMGSSSLTLWR